MYYHKITCGESPNNIILFVFLDTGCSRIKEGRGGNLYLSNLFWLIYWLFCNCTLIYVKLKICLINIQILVCPRLKWMIWYIRNNFPKYPSWEKVSHCYTIPFNPVYYLGPHNIVAPLCRSRLSISNKES